MAALRVVKGPPFYGSAAHRPGAAGQEYAVRAKRTGIKSQWTPRVGRGYYRRMDTVLQRPWTTETFLAWEDRQEGKHEFDGRDVVPMTGGSLAHQRIVFNLLVALAGLLDNEPRMAVQEMRLRAGARIRYPDVTVCSSPLDQTIRTLADAVAIFEVLSDDTATTDRVEKLIDYTLVPSLLHYVLLEQTAIAATVFTREPNGPWIASAQIGGTLLLPGLDITMPLADLYQGLAFPV